MNSSVLNSFFCGSRSYYSMVIAMFVGSASANTVPPQLQVDANYNHFLSFPTELGFSYRLQKSTQLSLWNDEAASWYGMGQGVNHYLYTDAPQAAAPASGPPVVHRAASLTMKAFRPDHTGTVRSLVSMQVAGDPVLYQMLLTLDLRERSPLFAAVDVTPGTTFTTQWMATGVISKVGTLPIISGITPGPLDEVPTYPLPTLVSPTPGTIAAEGWAIIQAKLINPPPPSAVIPSVQVAGGNRNYWRVQRTEVDSDNDGMKDWWELKYGLNPWVNDALVDSDGDGLSNADELGFNANPMQADTDGDGLFDGFEVAASLDPNNPVNRPQSANLTSWSGSVRVTPSQ